MKTSRLFPSFIIAAALALLLLVSARAAETTTVKFSDPAKPGTLKLQIARGDVRVTGADVAEITIKSDATPMTQKPRKDGLRVLSAASGFSVNEKDNVLVIDTMADGWMGGGSTFDITVPRSTNLVLNSSFGGADVKCSNLAGDIEIECMHGEVTLDGISGGALVYTMNGEIRATVAKLSENKPLSFSSMNGEVLVRLPGDSKANIRLRTQNGTILTDFDDKALVTKVENTPRIGKLTNARTMRGKGGVLPPEAHEAIQEAARAGMEAARVAQQALREAADAAREGADAAREAARAEADAARTPQTPDTPAAPAAPRPPKLPAIPAMTGGKLVTGILNGGGPEISVQTMNGDVTLRKVEQK